MIRLTPDKTVFQQIRKDIMAGHGIECGIIFTRCSRPDVRASFLYRTESHTHVVFLVGGNAQPELEIYDLDEIENFPGFPDLFTYLKFNGTEIHDPTDEVQVLFRGGAADFVAVPTGVDNTVPYSELWPYLQARTCISCHLLPGALPSVDARLIGLSWCICNSKGSIILLSYHGTPVLAIFPTVEKANQTLRMLPDAKKFSIKLTSTLYTAHERTETIQVTI